jgi:hypothetical protein
MVLKSELDKRVLHQSEGEGLAFQHLQKCKAAQSLMLCGWSLEVDLSTQSVGVGKLTYLTQCLWRPSSYSPHLLDPRLFLFLDLCLPRHCRVRWLM